MDLEDPLVAAAVAVDKLRREGKAHYRKLAACAEESVSPAEGIEPHKFATWFRASFFSLSPDCSKSASQIMRRDSICPACCRSLQAPGGALTHLRSSLRAVQRRSGRSKRKGRRRSLRHFEKGAMFEVLRCAHCSFAVRELLRFPGNSAASGVASSRAAGPAAGGRPLPAAGGRPLLAGGRSLPAAGGRSLPAAGGRPLPAAGGRPVPAASKHKAFEQTTLMGAMQQHQSRAPASALSSFFKTLNC